MSFKRKSYRLSWPDGHSFSGLVVSMKGLSLADLQTVSGLEGTSKESIASGAMDEVFAIVSKSIIRWNLTDEDDNPVPTDVDTLRNEDLAMLMEIIQAWTTNVLGVKASLGKDSNSGSPFREESIPMEML